MLNIVQTIKKGAAHNVIFRAGFLLLIIAAVVLPSMAFSRDWVQRGAENTVYGYVVSVDTENHLTVLTVQPSNIDTFLNDQMSHFVMPNAVQSDNYVMLPNDQINIFVNPNSAVKICNANEPARDLQGLREATITYHEMAGLAVADKVSEQC
jgi:hypothetical protein